MSEQNIYIPDHMDLVVKDWEIGFGMYSKHVSQITTIRGWTLTLILAYLGFLVSTQNFNLYLQIPMAFVIGGFFILELIEGMHMQFIGRRTLKIERIFSHPDIETRSREIKQYLFRDVELHERTHTDRLKWILSYAKGVRVVFWYFFLLLFAFGTFYLLRAKLP